MPALPTSTPMTSFPSVIAQRHERRGRPTQAIVNRPPLEVGQDFFKHANPANRKRRGTERSLSPLPAGLPLAASTAAQLCCARLSLG